MVWLLILFFDVKNTPMNKQLLLVDDDSEQTDLLSEYLSAYNIDCDIAENGEIALEKLAEHRYDLIVLDIMMPKVDGITVLKQLPTLTDTPVIMLTAKDSDMDRIIGLELGADDYIGKPYNPRELLARINVVIKRHQRARHAPTPQGNITTKTTSIFQLNHEQRTCYVDDAALSLTGTEFDLLATLIQYKGEVVEKSLLSQEVLQREWSPFDRSLDVHISRLRKKLSAHHAEAIKSVRGKGYQLTV